jgi:hypothetical protein
MIVRMGKIGQKKQRPRGIAPWRPLSRQHAADGLNSFIPHQRFDITGQGNGPKSIRPECLPEPYQNRIKTPSVEAVELAD